MPKPRHAIVLVHGQGEQRPMEMGPQFVEHVFMADFDPQSATAASDPQVRWVPESQASLDDTRRIEVRYTDDRPDIDVFELYWAPLMGDSRLSHFAMWFFGLLRRPRKELPQRVSLVHMLCRALIWSGVFLTLLYLYTTFCALFPTQIVQIARHGWSDVLQFAFDWRLAAFLSAFVLFLAAFIAAIVRNYGWCLSFLLSTTLICALAPLALGSRALIEADVAWLTNDYNDSEALPFNIWGVPYPVDGTVDVGPVTATAAAVTRFLCGTRP